MNEDAQGSVAHLQAEIKRLKEVLQQYQSVSAGQMQDGEYSHATGHGLLITDI